MRRVVLALCLLVLARPASAASLTVENLWELPITFVGFWAGSTEILSPDYGIQPVDALAIPITAATPLAGFSSLTLELPDSLSDGFTFGGLTIGGTCPQNCGWSAQGDQWPGTVFGLGTTIVNVLWPATDGSDITIARAIYVSGPSLSTPEPSTILLLMVGFIILSSTRRYSDRRARTLGTYQ